IVENQIMAQGAFEVAKRYVKYRYNRSLIRKSNTTDEQILTLIECNNEEVKQENSNKNPTVNSVQRDYMAGEVSKDLTRRILLPQDIVEAHEKGIIHFHDADYFAQHMHNCDLINLEDMLQNGTVISGTMIEKPHSFSTACNIATQIIAQIASSQYGGQSISLSHLAPFVDLSRKKFRKDVKAELEAAGIEPTDEQINKITEVRVKDEINRGVQMIQYQVITLMTTNGQAPFVTVFMYLDEVPEGQTRDDLKLIIEEVLRQRIQGVKNESGVWITPAFPKLIYVLDEDNITEGSKYWDVTCLAAKCTAKRMVPDYISAKKMKELKIDKNGNPAVYTCMGCRSFLTPYVDPKTGKGKYYGRFNQGVVTLNLVDIACSSGGDMTKFWKIFDERLDLCYRALMCRHNRLLGTPSDVAPILWQYGALARLKKGEKIDKLLFGGYSTISLGYAGLYECVKYMTGKSHTDPDAKDFAIAVMQKLNDACNTWKKQENIDFSVYGTPLESTTYKFAKCLQKRFGKIPGVTDKNYITNSYHVHVSEKIDAFKKLEFEAEFQKLSPGGAISYVEVPNMQDNIPAVLSVMQYIYNHIMYAELNTKSDYCQVCGYDGEIKIVEEEGKLVWRCPNCGNEDQNKLNVARRTCGYIGTQFWNQGRTQEIKDRVLHL
ncbi:MAG: anaerobic ribonucleoside-triphosphate reductase, partial [Eubacterium sp.]